MYSYPYIYDSIEYIDIQIMMYKTNTIQLIYNNIIY